ncbi:MAG: DNA polymerase III subunit delta' [Flavobacteriaceae bacterium]|nr:DNA polymerase III subunit delta' [Flavobacteriaceae bacterium]
MYTGNIVGQNLIKKQLHKMVVEETYPQSQILIDNNGYGGLPLAINNGLNLIYGLEKMKEYEKNKIPFSNIVNHPDLHFAYPCISKSKTNSTNTDLLSSWRDFIISSPYGDIYEWLKLLESGNKQGIINVDEVIKIQKKISLKSHSGGNKVLIIWGAEKLNPQASNKLLKIIEEPPEKSYFILVTEKSSVLLPTLISRCQKIKLPPIEVEEIEKALKKLNMNSNLTEIIKFSKGSWRKVLNDINNKEEKDRFENYLNNFLNASFNIKKSKKAIIDLLNWSESIASLEREEQKEFIKYVLEVIRQCLLISYNSTQLVDFQYFKNVNLKNLSAHIHSKNILEITTLLEETIYFLERNGNSKIILSSFSIELVRLLNVKE